MNPRSSRFPAVGLALLLPLLITSAIAGGAPKVDPAAAGAPTAKSAVGPRLTIDKPTIEVGDVVRGQGAVAVFDVRNTGDQVLKILDARPSCGCTVASFDKVIAPGESGKITANVKTDTFRGPIDKTVSVSTTDPSNASLTLHVKANVVGSVEVLPAAFLSFPSPPLMEYSGKLLIRREKSETGDLEVSDVTTSAPWLIAKVRKVKTPEPASQTLPEAHPGDWVLDLSAADDAPAETGGQKLTFKTGLPREPQVTIPLAISMTAPMQAYPASLIMVIPQGTPTAAGTFTVGMRPGLAKRAITAKADPDVFEVALQPDTDGRYKASVVWKAKGDAPLHDGTVIVSAGGETLSVPVRVLEKPATAHAAMAVPGAVSGQEPQKAAPTGAKETQATP